ncbi:MAG: hypothetical protein P4L10_13000 [Acidobacteriaceae bacterium]|nr:hypothetical protein [Acidobacteriaceae bacterium]
MGILIFVPVQARHLTKAQALLVAWVALVVVQTAMALSWKSRTKKEGIAVPRSFFWKTGVVALLTGIMTSVVVAQVAQPSSLMDLANSSIPLSDIQSPQKRLVVELLRKDIAATKANNEVLKKQKPIQPDIYSVASFENAETMRNEIVQLQPAVEIDKAYAEELVNAEQDFRKKMAQLDPAYLQSWDASRKQDVDANAHSIQCQGEWWKSFQDLYTYAAANADKILVRDDKLVINDGAIRSAFNEKLDSSKQLYDEYMAAVRKSAEIKKQLHV